MTDNPGRSSRPVPVLPTVPERPSEEEKRLRENQQVKVNTNQPLLTRKKMYTLSFIRMKIWLSQRMFLFCPTYSLQFFVKSQPQPSYKKVLPCKYYILFSGKPLPYTHLLVNILWGFDNVIHVLVTRDHNSMKLYALTLTEEYHIFISFSKVQWAVHLWCLNYRHGVSYRGEVRTQEIVPLNEGGLLHLIYLTS